jgi:hypothetical protein
VRLQRSLGNRYVQRTCEACRAGGAACAGCEEERSARPAAIQRAEFEILGKYAAAHEDPLRVFFEKDEATPDDDERKKLKVLAREPKPLELHGYTSEDEAPDLAERRVVAVDEVLAEREHKGTRTRKPRPEAGRGRLSYRYLRAVEIVLVGEEAATPDCEKIGTVVQCPEPPSPFTEARTKALAALEQTAGELGKRELEPGVAATVERVFGPPAETIAPLRDNLGVLQGHVAEMIDSKRHVCHNTCDPECTSAVAYNSGRGAEAVMTLCPVFMTDELNDRVHALVHEGSHGALGARDYAYSDERRVAYLSQANALANADSYALLVRAVAGLGAAKSPPADVVEGPGANEQATEAFHEALALAEAGLTAAHQVLTGTYATIVRSRPLGKWDNPFYEKTMPMLKMVFPSTFPTESPAVPSLREQTALAALCDRLLQLRLALTEAQTVIVSTEDQAVKWSSRTTPTVGPSFVGAPPWRRVLYLLYALFEATGLPGNRAGKVYMPLVLGLYQSRFAQPLVEVPKKAQ